MEDQQFHEEQLPLSNKAGVCGGDIAEDISNTRHNHADYHGRGGPWQLSVESEICSETCLAGEVTTLPPSHTREN